MPFWDYVHFGRPDPIPEEQRQYRNLQAGLMQIASQTCSILVQVNNTNNISYGNNATNVQYNNFSPSSSRGWDERHDAHRAGPSRAGPSSAADEEQSVELIPSRSLSIRGSTRNLFTHYKHRLSTVLENTTPAGDDDFELWDQNQMLRSEQQNLYNSSRWGPGGWCKPSCIPITVIFTLIVLVVLLPLLEHNNDKPAPNVKGMSSPYVCSDQCRIQLVESIPEGLNYPAGSPTFMSTYDAWSTLIASANKSIDIGSFYWSLRSSDIYNHTSSWQGEKIFQSILRAGTQLGVKVRIAQSQPTPDNPSTDTDLLARRKAAMVRSVNFPRLVGAGVLHTKVWTVDGQHAYLGSANMDWRSLTQVKELGVLIQNCSCLVSDVQKIFKVYWMMGREEARIPPTWPMELSTKFNYTTPLKVAFNDDEYTMNSYFSSSPPQMSTVGRAQDIDAIVRVIQNAEKFIHIAVMDYIPLQLYSAKKKYWPVIDDALRSAAVINNVEVKLLISWWNHSRPAEDYFLRSLEALTHAYKGVNLQVKRFVVPHTDDQAKIPFARVNHNKYMVTDRTAYIGTSNWSGDYFINTAGIGLVMQDDEDRMLHDATANNTTAADSPPTTIRSELAAVFERDWNSMYALELIR